MAKLYQQKSMVSSLKCGENHIRKILKPSSQNLKQDNLESMKLDDILCTIKYLVRDCFVSKNISRSVFFTRLVVLLNKCSATTTIEQILKFIDKELLVDALMNKGVSSIVIGRLLICGAMLRNDCLSTLSGDHLKHLVRILLENTYHDCHISLSYFFLHEILQNVDRDRFESSIWPILCEDLSKAWPEQNIQTIQCLLKIYKLFPTVINAGNLQSNFYSENLLNPYSYFYLYKIFWKQNNSLTEQVFQEFAEHIAFSDNITNFWISTVEPGLKQPTRFSEIITLKVLSVVLNHINLQKNNILDFLGDNFMQMFIARIKSRKLKKDAVLKICYDNFLETLAQCCHKINSDTKKLAIIQRLILPPGIINIEKYARNPIIHKLIKLLSEKGIKDLYIMYKNIFLAMYIKNHKSPILMKSIRGLKIWSKVDRRYVGYMLKFLLLHKKIMNAYNWREMELHHLLTYGIFSREDSERITSNKEKTVKLEFVEQCKDIFYCCLQSRLHDLQKDKKMLLNLAFCCQRNMKEEHFHQNFFIKQRYSKEKVLDAWRVMYTAITDETFREKVFVKENCIKDLLYILLLHMGFQLFRTPVMAIAVIEDLVKCLQCTYHIENTFGDIDMYNNDEQEWLQILTNIILYIISQDNNTLNNIVFTLFRYLCKYYTMNILYYILSMLDMENDNRIFDKINNMDNYDNEENEKQEILSRVLRIEMADEYIKSDKKYEEYEDFKDDNDTENICNINNKLHKRISKITDEDDVESIDLNELSKEDGEELDKYLTNAFKALKKSSSWSDTKKTNKQIVLNRKLMNFRIRILDLVNIFLEKHKLFIIAIDIILCLYKMLYYCIDSEYDPLRNKVIAFITKLTIHKPSAYQKYDIDIKNDKNYIYILQEKITYFARFFLEKKTSIVTPKHFRSLIMRLHNKCITFFIANIAKCSKKILDPSISNVISQSLHQIQHLLRLYVTNFITTRNSYFNINLLIDIFKLRWDGILPLSLYVVKKGLKVDTRHFRRLQIYKVICILYKNILEIHKVSSANITRNYLRNIENHVHNYVKNMATTTNVASNYSFKELQNFMELALLSRNVHQCYYSEISILTMPEILDTIRKIFYQIEPSKSCKKMYEFASSLLNRPEIDYNKRSAKEFNRGEKRKLNSLTTCNDNNMKRLKHNVFQC